jgi:hypothetical protein
VFLLLHAPPPAAAGDPPFFADDFESGGTCGWGGGNPLCPGFQVVVPKISVPAGATETWCYYFHASNSSLQAIRKWSSTMTPGSHHLILFTTPTDRKPPGTLDQVDCSISGMQFATWSYAAHELVAELELPADDGAGQPLAMEIVPAQPAFLQMYFFNASEEPLEASVVVDAFALEDEETYTRTSTYLTYNTVLQIPPNTTGDTETQACAPPASTQFWMFTTRTHKRGVVSRILDGANPLLQSNDWELPTIHRPEPFHSFAGNLTYECVYDNFDGFTVQEGESEDTDEQCIGVGYFFPSTGSKLCVNSVGPL